MRIVLRRKLVVLPILLLTVLAWTGHHLSTSYSCAQARSAKVARRNARAAQLRSLQADTSRLSVELEMLARSDHIQEVCRNYQLREDDNQDCGYRSKDQSFDQNIENHFLADPRTGTVYCFIHKVGFSLLSTCVLSFAMQVASSTWMSLFARLENKMKFLKQVEKDGNYYQVKYRLSPSPLQLLWSDSLSFLLVRHPLDRLISAYRDRILDPSTDQARQHRSAMMQYRDMQGTLQGGQPSFSQFLQYVADGGSDVHWAPYFSTCAPCLVGFDWIIKLEDKNMEEMQTALLDKSGMGKFVTLETKHRANSSSNEHKHLYREVDCEVIRKVVDMFKMDMMLFQYSAEQYLASGSVHC